MTMLPVLIFTDLWFGTLGTGAGVALYLLPTLLWLLVVTILASLETKHTYPERLSAAPLLRRFARVVPYAVINTGMLPHQFSAFTEGLFGALHSEFERTPKTASVAASPRPEAKRRYPVKVHWPYVLAEAFFVAYQLDCDVLNASDHEDGVDRCPHVSRAAGPLGPNSLTGVRLDLEPRLRGNEQLNTATRSC